MPPVFLATKFYIPPYRQNLVSRPRLLVKLDFSLHLGSKLTLISAPAGFGKTTLVLEWLQTIQRRQNIIPKVSWLSLDPADNDLAMFLEYLIAALQKGIPSIGRESHQLLENNVHLPASELLLPLINDLAGSSESILLVLDDYHTIQLPAIHEALVFLIEHQPPQLHIIVTTRQDPLFPLSRWRARGQITEIRLSDLRFTDREAADFLNQTMGLNLRTEDVNALENRTEGWIAGLQLAAVSLLQANEASGVGSLSNFIKEFAGNDRFIMDYLIDEVLARQPIQVQNFLLRTSILDRLNSAVCDRILAVEGGAKIEPLNFSISNHSGNSNVFLTSQEILDYLDRSNLFLIHLDSRRDWYRYHHLFAELLRHRLNVEIGPAITSTLHREAAHWFAEQNFTGEAVFHATKAQDFEWLGNLLEKTSQSPSTWSRGEVNQLLHWLESLPTQMIEARPLLSAQISRAAYITGDTQTGELWLKKAESALSGWPQTSQKDYLAGIIATNHTTFAMIREEIPEMLYWAKEALRLLPNDENFYRGRALYAIGLGQEELGDIAQARKTYADLVEVSLSIGDIFRVLNVTSSLAYLLIRQGCLNLAEQTCLRGLELSSHSENEGNDVPLSPAASLVQIPLGAVLFERNNLETAEKTLLDAIALAKQGGIVSVISPDIWIPTVFWAQLGMGKRTAAIETFREFEKIISPTAISFHQKISYEAQRAQMALFLGNFEDAIVWARWYEKIELKEFIIENPDLVLARVYLLENRFEDAITLLERLSQEARNGGFIRNLIEISILRAIALQKAERVGEAQSAFHFALELASPEKFVFVFTIEGSKLTDLLISAKSVERNSEITGLIERILAETRQSDDHQTELAIQARTPSQNQTLIEPLTDRELEVLQLIGEGFSNAEIAKKLYVSLNTLKAHTQNIYTKLDVHSRVLVVNKARELGMIK